MFQAMKWMKSIDIEGKGFITEQVFKHNRRGLKNCFIIITDNTRRYKNA